MFGFTRKSDSLFQPLADATRDGVDLTVSLPEQGAGEGARLINGLLGRFHDLVTRIAGAAVGLSQVAPHLSDLSRGLEERARTQQSNADTIAAATHTLKQTVSAIATSAEEASSFSEQVATATASANENGQESRKQIEAIGESTRTLAEQMSLLKTSSASIGEVVELIKNIADRTRLLSLNAAIEAARAGEQGRGFAVVADEVRKLADQTTTATQNVEALLATIQQQVTTSSDTMAAMATQVQEGITVSGQAGESIQAASRDIGTLIGHVHAIAEASQEQNEKVDAIADQIVHVVEATRHQLDDAHALAQSASKVKERSDTLLTGVGKFRFAGHKKIRDMIEHTLAGWKLERIEAADIDRRLVELCQREPAIEMVCVTDPTGRQVSADVAPGHFDAEGRKNNWHDRAWFREAIGQRRLIVSDLYRSVDTGDYCFTVSTPLIASNGQILGVLEADVRFEHIA